MRSICVVTGTRAEYGLLYWLLKAIEKDSGLKLQLVVTGMHLSPEFGLTYRAIESDGFHIDARIDMLLSGDSPAAIAKSVGVGVIGFADAFERLKPDIVVLLGDRFEILAAAQAAMIAKIPIAHLHGGEATEGAIDEPIRHAVTKMSQLHFVAASQYARRVVQMGEQPDRVFNTGALGLDNINRLPLLTREELERDLQFKFGSKNFLVTYHPVTLESQGPEAALAALFQALETFPEAHIIFTKANADAGGRAINELLDGYAASRPDRVLCVHSLGQLRYLSAMRAADAVIGNSSSGIIEAPFMGTPTVNIGRRQQGRLRSPSIVEAGETADSIAQAIRTALSAEMREVAARRVSAYGTGHASDQIAQILKSAELTNIVMKRFHDLPANEIP